MTLRDPEGTERDRQHVGEMQASFGPRDPRAQRLADSRCEDVRAGQRRERLDRPRARVVRVAVHPARRFFDRAVRADDHRDPHLMEIVVERRERQRLLTEPEDLRAERPAEMNVDAGGQRGELLVARRDGAGGLRRPDVARLRHRSRGGRSCGGTTRRPSA